MNASTMTPAEVLDVLDETASMLRRITAPASAGDLEEARAAVAALVAELDALRDALDHIGGLSRALRQGGPDPMDLEGLSDALSEAVDTAHNALAALSGAGHE